MTTNRSQLLRIAKSYLGAHGAVFRKFAGLPAGASYCNAYVDYIAHESGVSALYFDGRKETYCPHSIEWCRKNLAQVPLYLALPMDLIYFDWEPNGKPNHIGLAENRISTSAIKTVEGNTDVRDKKGRIVASGVVAEKTRSGSYVQAVFRVHFAPAETPKKCRLLEDNTEFGYVTTYNLQCALGMKPTGILTKETVKYLQRKAGCTPDGVWSTGTSKAVQKMTGATPDGDFGPASVIALKKWINRINFPVASKKPAAATPAKKQETTKPKAPAKKGYTGPFPTLNTNAKILNGMAVRQCWPYGTPTKKYTYKKGKPLAAYTKGIDEAYPNHKSWPNKKQRVGACCDVFPGECLCNVDIPVPKDLKNQIKQMPKMTDKLKVTKYYTASQLKAGMIIQRGRKDYSGHTMMICELLKIDQKTGKVTTQKYIANAHYKKLGGTYAVMDSKSIRQKPSKWKYYRCYIALGACRTWYGEGDYGIDVLRIQRFLAWAGFYKGTPSGSYTSGTAKAVSNFQKAVGLKVSGRVGEMTIKKMKAYKK